MLNTHHPKIQSCIEEYLMSNTQKEKATAYMQLQNQHLRLLCKHYPARVLDRVRKIKRNEIHLALDDCLDICQEYKQVEACAILKNKMTNYFSSVTEYLTLIKDK